MAYFPNGTSGMMYEEQYCANCVHVGSENSPGCAVFLLHMLFNYDQCKDDERGKAVKEMLGLLIPETKDGLGAEQCTMFRASADPEAEWAEQRRLAEQPTKYEQVMAEARKAA